MDEKLNAKELYTVCSLLVKKAEEEVSEGKQINQDILDRLTEAYEKIITFEKMYLIRCQDRFYGAVLMDLDIIIDFKQQGPVDLKVDTDPMQLGINPMWCASYTFPEFTGLIVGEIVRMCWLHPEDFAKLNSEKDKNKHDTLEKASDAAAYSVVRNDIHLRPAAGLSSSRLSEKGLRLPPDAYTTADINKDCKVFSQERQTLQYYYDILTRKSGQHGNSGAGSGSGNNNASQSSNTTASTQPANENGISTRNNSDGKPIHNWEDSDADSTKQKIVMTVKNAYDSLSEQSRGFIAGSVQSQIKVLLEPPQVSWKQILAKMIGAVPIPYRKTRRKLNKKQPYRSDLYGRMSKRTVNIVCCFDTSGSMSDDDLKYCLNEVFNIIKVYEGSKITVIECDSEVQRVYEARRMSDVKTMMMGRGGTSYVPAIKFINGEEPYTNRKKYPLAGKFRDALMVYFTDGFGDYEIPRPKTTRNLWVVLNDSKNLSVKNPYGEVVSISTDSGWHKR